MQERRQWDTSTLVRWDHMERTAQLAIFAGTVGVASGLPEVGACVTATNGLLAVLVGSATYVGIVFAQAARSICDVVTKHVDQWLGMLGTALGRVLASATSFFEVVTELHLQISVELRWWLTLGALLLAGASVLKGLLIVGRWRSKMCADRAAGPKGTGLTALPQERLSQSVLDLRKQLSAAAQEHKPKGRGGAGGKPDEVCGCCGARNPSEGLLPCDTCPRKVCFSCFGPHRSACSGAEQKPGPPKGSAASASDSVRALSSQLAQLAVPSGQSGSQGEGEASSSSTGPAPKARSKSRARSSARGEGQGSGRSGASGAQAPRARSVAAARSGRSGGLLTEYFEELPEGVRLDALLDKWTSTVRGWLNGANAHPGRAIRLLEARERALLQHEADTSWYLSPFACGVRGVFINGVVQARQAHWAALELLDYVLREGVWIVILLGFTFDREDIAERLIAAAKRQSAVIGVFDKKMTFSGQTRLMAEMLSRMAAGGVAVRVLEGDSSTNDYEAVGRTVGGFKGIQHAKGLLVYRQEEAFAILGSCNWTTASRANSELGVILRAKAEGAGELLRRFGLPVLRSADYVEAARAAHLLAVSGQSGSAAGPQPMGRV